MNIHDAIKAVSRSQQSEREIAFKLQDQHNNLEVARALDHMRRTGEIEQSDSGDYHHPKRAQQ
jgi:hypothetical protein